MLYSGLTPRLGYGIWGCSANGNTLLLQGRVQGSIPCSSTVVVGKPVKNPRLIN